MAFCWADKFRELNEFNKKQKAGNIKNEKSDGLKCPVCKNGVLREKRILNDVSWECGNYPKCKAVFEFGVNCPVCQKGILSKKTDKSGIFWQCSRHLECNTILNDNDGYPECKVTSENKIYIMNLDI